MMYSLSEIQNMVRDRGIAASIDDEFLNVRTCENSNAYPYVEINDSYKYICSERGYLISQKETMNVDELLYWIFEFITFKLSVKFELKNRCQGVDSRRLIFLEQIRLMSVINKDWGIRLKGEIDETLASNPYFDN